MNNRFGLVAVIMTILVGVILIGTLLAPTIEGIQKTVGEEVEYSNVQDPYTYRLAEKNETVTIAITGTGGTITYNGEEITDEGFTVMTDTISVRASGSNLYVTSPDGNIEYRTTWNSKHTIVFENGTCTNTDDSNDTVTETEPYSWIYIPDENGEWVTATWSKNHYVNTINDIMCSGYYSTGDNDTGYSVKNGVATVSDTTYTAGLTYTLTLVDGTTDVYRVTNYHVHVGDEEFEPWFILIKGEITGHEASGTEYTLYGVVVVLFIVILFVVAVRSLISRERD